MTGNQIKRILRGAGIDSLTGAQLVGFRCLILTTNHGIEYNQDVITFDTANELTKIKSYSCEGISGRFDMNWVACDNGIEFHSTMSHRWYPFRKPKNGDIIFIVRGGSILDETTTIKNISFEKVIFNDNIELKSGDIVCYADPFGYNSHPIADPVDPSLLLIKTPKSNNAYDVYLDTNEIIGLETSMGMAGNF